MKRSFTPYEQDRFHGPLRHYHRAGSQPHQTWEEWIDKKAAKTRSKKWRKIIAILIAVLTLGGISVGLFIKYRSPLHSTGAYSRTCYMRL
jgi:hypothetical protein